jgi:hypothetical protein
VRPTLAGVAELADAKVSKTFGLTPVGVRFPLPAPFKIKDLFSRRNAFSRVWVRKLCQKCANATAGTER